MDTVSMGYAWGIDTLAIEKKKATRLRVAMEFAIFASLVAEFA